MSSGLAQRDSDGAVVFRMHEAAGAAQPAAASPVGMAFTPPETLPDDSGGDDGSDGYSVQLASTASGSAASSTAAASAGAGANGADLDELARKLYGRIRLHLRKELLLDRERSGSLVETRR